MTCQHYRDLVSIWFRHALFDVGSQAECDRAFAEFSGSQGDYHIGICKACNRWLRGILDILERRPEFKAMDKHLKSLAQ